MHFHLHISCSFQNWLISSDKSASHKGHIAQFPTQGTLSVVHVKVKDSQAIKHGHWNPPLSW